MSPKLKKLFYLFLPILLGTIVGFIISPKEYYTNLVKPPLSPPSILFPIMWTIIYLLMGISFYILKNNNEMDDTTEKIYYTQLFVNILWSIIFFVFKLKLLSCLWIILLDILVIIMVYRFFKKNKLSAYLNFLYVAWILFATYLTIGIYVLN